MFDIKRELIGFESELKALRRDFHEYPELGFNEFRTSKIIYDYLKKLKIEVKNIAKTGVVGILKGDIEGNDKTILLKANMDALPIDEKTELLFASKNTGIMHAAGHDAQMAILLVTAKILSRHKHEFSGTVKFVFQPNEEEEGATDMIEAGVLEKPTVSAAVAVDFWNEIPTGYVGLSKGVVLGVTEEFEISLFGKAANTSLPHKGKDTIIAAAKIIESLQFLETREYDPLCPIAVMIGSINGGKSRNMISDYVKMGGTIRFLFNDDKKNKDDVIAAFKRIIKGVCDICNVDYEIKFIPSNPSLVNDEKVVKILKKEVEKMFNNGDRIVEFKSLVGEDFAQISQIIPSAIVFLGINNEEIGVKYPMYHPKFTIDEDVMKYGVEIFVCGTMELLNSKEI